jgi:hypothetical protein
VKKLAFEVRLDPNGPEPEDIMAIASDIEDRINMMLLDGLDRVEVTAVFSLEPHTGIEVDRETIRRIYT